MTSLSLVSLLIVSAIAAVLAAPWFAAPSFDEVIRGCMQSEATEPPAQRTATCLCHVDEMQGWMVNARLLVAGSGSREITRRASLNQCRASAARLN